MYLYITSLTVLVWSLVRAVQLGPKLICSSFYIYRCCCKCCAYICSIVHMVSAHVVRCVLSNMHVGTYVRIYLCKGIMHLVYTYVPVWTHAHMQCVCCVLYSTLFESIAWVTRRSLLFCPWFLTEMLTDILLNSLRTSWNKRSTSTLFRGKYV